MWPRSPHHSRDSFPLWGVLPCTPTEIRLPHSREACQTLRVWTALPGPCRLGALRQAALHLGPAPLGLETCRPVHVSRSRLWQSEVSC